MIGAIRVSAAGFLDEFHRGFGRAALSAPLAPRNLVDMAMRHPHEGIGNFHWGCKELTE